jgi:DNA mismatch endonuclease (patch repair protein)
MDIFIPEKRSEIMSKVKGKDTSPEVRLRKALWAAGFRYRKHYGPHKIDVAFPGRKVAVFVDGCFWHGCPAHASIPESNMEYWVPKLERNKRRDFEVTAALEAQGWAVIRIWEHELKDIDGAVRRIREAICRGRS